MQCREKTFFNPKTSNCDWPENVDTTNCIQLLKTDDDDNESTEPPTTADAPSEAENLAE